MLTVLFEIFIKVCDIEYDIKPLYCVNLPGYTWVCVKKYTNIKLEKLQDKNMIRLFENKNSGGIWRVFGERYIKSDESKQNNT